MQVNIHSAAAVGGGRQGEGRSTAKRSNDYVRVPFGCEGFHVVME